jgi:hypothetical protein
MSLSRRESIHAAIVAGTVPPASAVAPQIPAKSLFPGPSSIRHREILANGLRMHVADRARGH